MPKIATLTGDQARTAVTRGPRATASPVSTAVAKGVGDLARGLAERADRINTTEAEEAVVKFEREKNNLFFDPKSGYFNTQGKSAHTLSSDANESLQQLAKTHAEAMSNPQARQMFTRIAERHVTSGQTDIMRHASKGLEAWEITTINAQTENTIENASLFRNDDKKLSVQRALGRQSIHDAAELEGVTGDALNERLQTFESSFASATIDAAILDSADDGKKALDNYGDRLEEPDRLKLRSKLEAKEKSEKTQSDAQESVMIATKVVADHAGNRTEVLEALKDIEDPEIQSKARKEAMYQINQMEEARTEDRAEAYEVAESYITDNGSAEAFKASHPDEWEKLSPKQQRNLEKGVPVVNDWGTWHNVMSMSESEIRNMGADEVEKITAKLDSSHRDKFYTMWKKRKTPTPEAQIGRTRAAQTKSSVEQLMNKKSSKWKTEDKAKADSFYALIDSEVNYREEQAGKPLSAQEYTELLNNFTRKVIIEKDWWPDPELELDDVPEEHLGELTKALRLRNIPVTSDTLIRAWQQAK